MSPQFLPKLIHSFYKYLSQESEDQEAFKSQVAWYVSTIGLACTVILSAGFFVSGNIMDFTFSILASGLLLTIIAMLYRGWVDPAVSIMVWGATIVTWAGVFVRGGMGDIGIQTIYPIFIIIAVVYSMKWGVYFGLISVYLLILLMALESRGIYDNARDPDSYIADGVLTIGLFLLMTLITGYVMYKLNQTNLKLTEAHHDLERLVNEKDDFLSMLTHDMKSPLTAIGLSAELLDRYPHLIHEKPDVLKRLLKSQQGLIDLVNNIVEVEQIKKTGQIEMQIERLDLLNLVQETVSGMQAQASQQATQLSFESSMRPSQPTEMLGDRSQLMRMLTNLISNAIKYSPDDTKVVVRFRAVADRFELSVQDQGYGIPEAELSKVFDYYYRIKSHSKKATGSGIGLAIVKRIVEQHSGEISVESLAGKGTCFTILLPVT